MPSTYLSLHYHLVFSTKERAPLIALDWRARLHEYLGGTIRGLGGFPQGVGGVADHVHLLVGLKSTHCLADVMRHHRNANERNGPRIPAGMPAISRWLSAATPPERERTERSPHPGRDASN